MQTDRYSRPVTRETEYDAGLRNHMLSVYNRMTAGVLITALVAWIVGHSPVLLQLFLGGPQSIIVMLAPLAVIMFGFNPATMSSQKLMMSFIGVSILYGISFSTIALVYVASDIARAFFISSAMFAGVSIYGYTTKRDLGPVAVFATMAIWGVILMSITGLFFHFSSGVELAVSVVSILAFAGVTAWQTQAMKTMYNEAHGEEINSRLAWIAALNLYVSFIAIFMRILRITGDR